MAFPISYLDLQDIGRRVRVVSGGAVIEDTLLAVHARRDDKGTLVVTVETTRFGRVGLGERSLTLDPGSSVAYVDGR